MLPTAVMPPNTDHMYAQVVGREVPKPETPQSVSPYKNVPGQKRRVRVPMSKSFVILFPSFLFPSVDFKFSSFCHGAVDLNFLDFKVLLPLYNIRF